MNVTKLGLAIALITGSGLIQEALALDLYVDTKTQQIYAEPGPGRTKLGAFEKVEDSAAKKAEADAQKAEIQQIKEDLALKNNELKALDEHVKVAEETKVKMGKKGVEFESADKDFKFRMGGRIHADASYTSGDDDLKNGATHIEANDGTEMRRTRIEMLGTFYKDWDFKSQYDFADNAVAVKDMFIQYNGVKDLAITAGQQKQAFSRELQESSNDMMFMERSLMDALNAPTVDRAIGLNVASLQKDWTGQVGVYGDTVTANSNSNNADEGWGISSRWTYAPINEKTKLIHLGIAGNYRDPNANDQVTDQGLRLRSETSHMSNLNLIDTGVIAGINSVKMVGLEANALYGPFTLGGEYTQMWLDRERVNANNSDNLEFNGWYTEASWTITGESRKYKHGKFYQLEPKQNFSFKNGTWGAWELAARYAEADLNSGNIRGGQLSNLTVALNWYMNTNIRFMADYNKTLDMSGAPIRTTGGQEPNVDTFMLRGQLAF